MSKMCSIGGPLWVDEMFVTTASGTNVQLIEKAIIIAKELEVETIK
jgi:hypothetical protein